MLTELKVTNFAIIDEVDVLFRPGFNVLSGETGSGKSVLLKSLALLMGEKSVSDTIKSGAAHATVEGSFDISRRSDIKLRLIEAGISDATKVNDVEDLLIVRRMISSDGKNRVYVNGRLSTLQQLREIVSPLIELTGHPQGVITPSANASAPAPLIEMTGQHDNRNLHSKSFHLESLDHASSTLSLRRQYYELYKSRAQLLTELARAKEKARTSSERLDFLTFQRDEINAVDFRDDEEKLLETLQTQKDSKRLLEFIASAEAALYSEDDSALVRLHRVLQGGVQFSNSELKKNLESLAQAKNYIEDAVYQLREYGQNLAQDPASLEDLENRVSQIKKLQKKYGGSTVSVLSSLARIEAEISQIETLDDSIEKLEKAVSAQTLELKQLAAELHLKRRKGAVAFAREVNRELADLNMKGLTFSVRIDELAELVVTGSSDVEFQIRNSKDDEPRPLAKFASGGELSRILLALKCVVGQMNDREHAERPQTYIFDEVDAGVSGMTAEKVGRKLSEISEGQQVICVTHLPQVAAFADTHFVIDKSTSTKAGVHMTVTELAKADRVNEIARMLSGEKVTRSSIANAQDLLRLSSLQ